MFDHLNTTNIHKNSTSCVKATIFCTPKARSDFLCTDSSWYQKHHSSKASKPVAFLFHGKLSFALWCSAVSLLLVVASQVAIPHLQYHQAHEGNTGVFYPLTILPWLVQPNAVPSVDSQPEWHLPWQRNVAMFEGVPTMRSNAWRIRRFSKLCNLIGEGMQTHIPLNASRCHSAEWSCDTSSNLKEKHLPRRFLCRGAGSFSWRVTRRTSCQAPRLENHFFALLWIFGNKLWPLGSGFDVFNAVYSLPQSHITPANWFPLLKASYRVFLQIWSFHWDGGITFSNWSIFTFSHKKAIHLGILGSMNHKNDEEHLSKDSPQTRDFRILVFSKKKIKRRITPVTPQNTYKKLTFLPCNFNCSLILM